METEKKVTPESLLRDFRLAEKDSEHRGRGVSVLLVPETDFNVNVRPHPLERLFVDNGISYEFTLPGDHRVGSPGFYMIDLTQIKVDYASL